MTETPGFFRANLGLIEFAPTSVHAPDYTLLSTERDTYELPLPGGWIWMSGPTEALTVLGQLSFLSPNSFGIGPEPSIEEPSP